MASVSLFCDIKYKANHISHASSHHLIFTEQTNCSLVQGLCDCGIKRGGGRGGEEGGREGEMGMYVV